MSLSKEKVVLIDGEFILVIVGNEFRIGVQAVKPGAEIIFEGLGDFAPQFQGSNPFGSTSKSEGDLLCTIPASCSPGAYSFGLTASSGAPTTYPYTIHVVNEGAAKATYRLVNEKLRVVMTLPGKAQTPQNINIKKEGFTAAVQMTVTYSGQSQSFSIPAAETSYLWHTPGTADKYTFKVAPPSQAMALPDSIHTEVIGSDESDLDILPPEG